MDRDPVYSGVRRRVAPAVGNYHKHTYLVQNFLTEHGLKVRGWETWDVAPFHVLNARKGQAVPKELLQALDAAISGRQSVSDQFTVANFNAAVLMDASDITHRVFVERLRTMRRVWFPDVPENTIAAPKTARTSVLTSSLTLVQAPNGAAEATKVGVFSALAGASTGSDFCKVSFDKPVEMTIVTGTLKCSFEVSTGHVKLTQCLNPATSRVQTKPKLAISSLKQTAADIAARGNARAIKKNQARLIKNSARNMPVAARCRVITRWMAKSARAQVSELAHEQTSDEEDSVDDEASSDKTLSPESATSNRRIPFGQDKPELADCESSTLPAAQKLTKRTNFRTSARRAIPALSGSHNRWIVDVSPFGDITFFDPNGASPCTYLEEEEARDRLRDLWNKRLPMVVTVKYGGQAYQLSDQAIDILSTDSHESIVEMTPQLIAVT